MTKEIHGHDPTNSWHVLGVDVMGRRRKNSGGAAGAWGVAIIIMAMFGACIDDDTTDPGKSAPKAWVNASVFTARVVDVSWKVTVEVEGSRPYFYLANAGSYGPCAREFGRPYDQRLAELLPVGVTVTVVRGGRDGGNDYVYFHLPPPGSAATDTPYGASVNEQLITEGLASFTPTLKREQDSPTVETQVAELRTTVAPQLLPYFDALTAADIAAWNNQVGLIPECLARLNRERSDRERQYGPDGRPGTSDDPDDGNEWSNGNGGGDDGENWFCRRRRWC
ncbi:hypothetical protein [Nocardia amikacinitolerans]|uniref:hypothetical protein n=1 Tax=Nocardia amikacinitolerans TaxID=756689 RepID=UPI0012EE89FF|nr:hypothetical protein [Nocardia amikacinitolerans]